LVMYFTQVCTNDDLLLNFRLNYAAKRLR
jgi:hypothetical protein